MTGEAGATTEAGTVPPSGPTTPVPGESGPPPADDAGGGSGRRSRVRRWLTVLVLVLVAAFWVRIVLFEWVFPVIERQIDNPELQEAIVQAPVAVDALSAVGARIGR